MSDVTSDWQILDTCEVIRLLTCRFEHDMRCPLERCIQEVQEEPWQ